MSLQLQLLIAVDFITFSVFHTAAVVLHSSSIADLLDNGEAANARTPSAAACV